MRNIIQTLVICIGVLMPASAIGAVTDNDFVARLMKQVNAHPSAYPASAFFIYRLFVFAAWAFFSFFVNIFPDNFYTSVFDCLLQINFFFIFITSKLNIIHPTVIG